MMSFKNQPPSDHSTPGEPQKLEIKEKGKKTKSSSNAAHSPVPITPSATFDSFYHTRFESARHQFYWVFCPALKESENTPRTLPLRKWILLVRHHLLWTWFPRFLDPPLDAAVLLARRLAVLDQLECVQLKSLKGPEGHHGSPEHLEHLVAVVHLFAYDAVWQTIRPHAHIFAQLLP